MERQAFFIFSSEEKYFAELWIAVSYFTLEEIVEWLSAKVGVLQKGILKCSSSEPLVKIFENYMWKVLSSRAAGVKSTTLLKKDFHNNYFSKIKTSDAEQLF